MRIDNNLKCPVCGKNPRAIAYAVGDGWECEIKCKPLFRKPHYAILEWNSFRNHAIMIAVEEWNKAYIKIRGETS